MKEINVGTFSIITLDVLDENRSVGEILSCLKGNVDVCDTCVSVEQLQNFKISDF